jgi:hypothetical protein
MYGTFQHVIVWAGMLGASRQDMAVFRLYHLAALVGCVVLGMYLLVSRRLREHLDVHSFLSPALAEGSTIYKDGPPVQPSSLPARPAGPPAEREPSPDGQKLPPV